MTEASYAGEDKPPLKFISALVTGHFAVWGTSASTVSESGSPTLYFEPTGGV